MNLQGLYRTATYWPPGSWENRETINVGIQVQALWSIENNVHKVHLLHDVAEGGYLYDGITNEEDPTILPSAMVIDAFYSYPDLRTLKQIRIAEVSFKGRG